MSFNNDNLKEMKRISLENKEESSSLIQSGNIKLIQNKEAKKHQNIIQAQFINSPLNDYLYQAKKLEIIQDGKNSFDYYDSIEKYESERLSDAKKEIDFFYEDEQYIRLKYIFKGPIIKVMNYLYGNEALLKGILDIHNNNYNIKVISKSEIPINLFECIDINYPSSEMLIQNQLNQLKNAGLVFKSTRQLMLKLEGEFKSVFTPSQVASEEFTNLCLISPRIAISHSNIVVKDVPYSDCFINQEIFF